MVDSTFEHWAVEYDSGIPVYRQIINQAGAAVAAGTLKTGDQLPTIRALSAQLQINPNTVARAYRELELKGLIVSERGNGTFIQAQPGAPNASKKTTMKQDVKKAKLKKLYQQLMTEAADQGVTETELLTFIKTKTLSTPVSTPLSTP